MLAAETVGFVIKVAFAVAGEGAATFGGGGSGAIPTADLSLDAAAAAADAYFKISPGALVGIGAGFIEFAVVPLVMLPSGVCSEARAGKGDFS